jgi:DNA repair exonuclease SbcCD ATPase subunit
MEAATTIPFSQVRVAGDRLYVDGLVIDDECAVRLASEAENAAALVGDVIEIGARVLDREQTGSQVEMLKAELEKATRSAGQSLDETAARMKSEVDAKLAELLGPETGHLARALSRHFGDESSEAVQHKVRNVVRDVSAQMRDDLRKQFSSDSESNPLAGFQKASLAMIKQSSDQQLLGLTAMSEKLEAMKLEITELRAEKEKLEEVSAEREKGAAKGRSYEEAVFEAVDAIARGRGDGCDAVGDTRGEGGRKGDVVVGVDACSGQPKGTIVFEAKDRQLSRNAALAELDGCLETRSAGYAILVVPSEAELPARTHPNHEFNANKVFCVFDPEDGSTLSLEAAYTIARARVLMARDDAEGLDATALRSEVERATQALEEVRKIKSQLTNATNGIENARALVEAMAATVRNHLAQANALLDAAEPDEG